MIRAERINAELQTAYAELRETIASLLQAERFSSNQNIEIIEDLTENLTLVSVDAEQIKQVLLNLAINALRAKPEGGKLVFRTAQENKNLRIEIEDTGGGIIEELKSKISTRFFTTKDKGLGLGISVVHQIVSRHNGQIEIFDTPKGKKFLIILPV